MRISVTDLDAFRYWRDNEDANVTDLIRRLKREEPPTPQMIAGRAFSELLDRANGILPEQVTVNGIEFDFSEMSCAVTIPPSRQVKLEMPLATPLGPVTLVSVADGITGLRIHDEKLTERFDAEKYERSLQWRCYLEAFHAAVFVYDIFVAKYEGNRVIVREHHAMAFYPYPRMREDIIRAVEEFQDAAQKIGWAA